MIPRSARHAGDVRAVHQTTSLLLSYPDRDLLDRLPLLRQVADAAPDGVRQPLVGFLRHIETTPLGRLQQDYVATFDLKRRRCLYLTFWTHGDTRNRGRALLSFHQWYAAHGVHLDADELPDHLAVVLEFAATVDRTAGIELLLEHRVPLILIHRSLAAAGSPYALVLAAVDATLPPAGADVLDRAQRLARGGPARELVGREPRPGLDPYPGGAR